MDRHCGECWRQVLRGDRKVKRGVLHSTGVWRGTVEEEAEVKEHMIKKAISKLKISGCDI